MGEDWNIQRVRELLLKGGPALGAFPEAARRIRHQRELSLSLSIPNIGVFRSKAALAQHIHTCIQVLDRVEGDPDLEEEPDMEEEGDLEAETGA